MKYFMQSSGWSSAIKATVFHGVSGSILTFQSQDLWGPALVLHIPPAVADATAAAFNKAMAEHEAKTASKFPAPEPRSVDGLAEW